TATVPASYLDDGPGGRVVRGRMKDKDGGFTDYTTTVTINNVVPTANAGGPYSGTAGTTIIFKATATDPSQADTAAGFTYTWDFGDGGVGSGPTPGYAYAKVGTYTVRLTAKDKDGGQGTATTTVSVSSGTASPVIVDDRQAGFAETGSGWQSWPSGYN